MQVITGATLGAVQLLMVYAPCDLPGIKVWDEPIPAYRTCSRDASVQVLAPFSGGALQWAVHSLALAGAE